MEHDFSWEVLVPKGTVESQFPMHSDRSCVLERKHRQINAKMQNNTAVLWLACFYFVICLAMCWLVCKKQMARRLDEGVFGLNLHPPEPRTVIDTLKGAASRFTV